MVENLSSERLRELAAASLLSLETAVVGQGEAAATVLAGYMAGGHVLIEGVPGIGKTLLGRAFASVLGLSFSRIQFTPDLMPTDVIGMNVYDAGSRTFRLVKGPVFTDVLMADEINRTPPKTQSALLEAMQERQVTIDGVAHVLPAEFFVMATQNPVEFEGTYPLPEAQLDRFLARVQMTLPDQASEASLYARAANGEIAGWTGGSLPTATVTADEARALRTVSRRVHVAADLMNYLALLAAATRRSPHVELGVSPRGGLSLLELARAGAFLAGRDFVTPDDFKRFVVPCWAHRLILKAESELEGETATNVLTAVAAAVDVPR